MKDESEIENLEATTNPNLIFQLFLFLSSPEVDFNYLSLMQF